IGIEKLRVVVIDHSIRYLGRGVIRVFGGDGAQHDRGVGYGAGERPRCVLTRGDGNNAAAASAANGWFYTNQGGRAARAQNRCRRFRADRGSRQACRRRRAWSRTGATRSKKRRAMSGAAAWIVGIVDEISQ